MKTKLLSLLLVITLLAVTVSTGLPTILAADENLITNGDFADYSGGKPTGWNTSFAATSGATIQVVEDVQITDSLKANAVKITTSGTYTSTNGFTYDGTIKIEKNASYTMTYWVKVNKIKGIRTYMFEPNYIDKNGNAQTSKQAMEGQNIYSYSYDSGSTRVIRTDVKHSWKIAETGTMIDSSTVSMFISRSGGTEQVLTPDYPNTNREGEWMQVIHTFSTGNDVKHEANVAYDFRFPAVPGGELWIADVKMSVVKSEIVDYYTAAVNDDKLGCTTKDVPLINGKTAEITAEAYGENKFDGWFVDGELVSEEKTLTFTYDPNNPPKYEARFTKAEWGIDGSLETGYTNGELLAQAVTAKDPKAADTDWTPTTFLSTDKASKGYYVESNYGGTWRKANITQSYTHSGKTAIEFAGQYGMLGRKFSGLDKNTEYKFAAYIYSIGGGDGKLVGLGNIAVTDANTSSVGTRSDGTINYYSSDTYPGVLAWDGTDIDATKGWTKVEITFNSKESTEVILWLESAGLNAKMYIDDYSIARVPAAFKPQANDANLGFASPAEGVVCIPGDEVTFTATPFDGNYFEGWYVGDKLVSAEPTYTFVYNAELSGLKAHFKSGDVIIPNAGFENGYTDGQVLAEQSADISYENGKDISAWNEDLYKTTSKDGNNMFFIDSDWSKWGKAIATTEQAYTGKFSVKFSPNSRLIGYKISGLKEETNYAVSFFAMTKNTTASGKTIGTVLVTDSNMSCITKTDDGLLAVRKTATGALGEKDCGGINFRDTWEKVTVEFNSKDSTEIIVWVRTEAAGTAVYLDNFAVFEPISTSVSADLGGSITSNLTSKIICKGTPVTVSATPLEGNTFAGWFDMSGNLISDQANYSFTASESFTLLAKFDGYNKPATDMFAINGNDGTFENGTVPGWFFRDPTYGCEWCSATVSSKLVYEGKNSIEINARYRNTLLPLTGLVPNCDYRLSFYINQPDTDEKAKVDSMAIVGEFDEHLGTAGTIFASTKLVAANSGWNRIDIYFNSGANIAANLIIRFSAETLDSFHDRLYIDNLSFHRYDAAKEVQNGSFDDGKANWIGDGTVVNDGNNNVFSLGANESVYQDVSVDTFSSYTVSFKAKGKLTAAAQDLAKFDLNVKNYLSSKSYVEADGSEWTEYSYKFYSGVHKATNLVFKADENGAMIDDFKVTKNKQSAGSIIEHIDFETERFALTAATDTSVYSLYTSTSPENDPYVYSGNRSLKYTYNELLKNTSSLFSEAYLSYQPGIGNSLKVSMKLKIVGGKDGGFVGLAPEYSGNYGGDTGFEHMAKTSDWQTLSFYINNTTYAVFKAKINSIIGNTTSDFYVDDIVIEITPPMVMEENSKITYCERLYNAVDNEGFENAASNKDWANLPSTAKIVKGKALKGDYFLRVEGGTHYVLPVAIEPNKEYYFAASIRGSANTVGTIGVTIDGAGTEYYLNRDGDIASVVKFDSSETGWKRSAFKFTTDSDVAYLTIDVKAGALEIDSVMMFTSDYGYRFDPNDYTVYVPYDYENLKSPTTVINGGFGDQPYYKGPAVGDDSASPSTGDSIVLPVITIVLAVLASAVLMLIRKRKEGAENA